jgi:hypothetical protein
MASVLLFQGNPGSAVQLVASPGGIAGTVSMITTIKHSKDGQESDAFEGSGGTEQKLTETLFKNYSAIITGISIEEAANANAMYAADGRIYMHVPGDKLGSLIVSGISFAGNCGSNGSQNSSNQKEAGLIRMLNWYRQHRVSNPEFTGPISVTLGNETILEGYLGSFSSRILDVANQIYNFTLPMYLVPHDIGVPLR